VNTAIAGLLDILPNASQEDIQLAITGTSSPFFQSLDDDTRTAAIAIIIDSMGNVYVPVYVGAALCLVLSCCFTVSDLRARINRCKALTQRPFHPQQGKMFQGAVSIVA
jgi:hypothetical protein